MSPSLVMDHARNPRNAGALEGADAVGRAGDTEQGQMVVIHLRFADGRIARAGFQTFGCAYTIAACSLLTEWITGRTALQAVGLTPGQLTDMLGGLPPERVYCASLAVEALQDALATHD